MGRFKPQFIHKLHVAFATLMLVTLALAWYFNDSVRWYKFDVQRITLANEILQGYQDISYLALQELNTQGASAMRGDSNGVIGWESNAAELQAVITSVRQGISAEAAFDRNANTAEKLKSLDEIESLIDEIIRTSDLIDSLLKEGLPEEARDELKRLNNTGTAEYFASLITAVILDQKLESRSADEEAIALARYITNLLPILMTILVIFTLFIIFLFSRNLTRSVSALHEGALAFREGNLSHRIPELTETEFSRLGKAFNSMAIELSDHRTKLRDANVRLETVVDERTRALQASNKKLEEVDVNRRKLLADISHEFRTPLTVIRGESEIALRGTNKTKADYKEAFQRIVDQTDKTTRLVDDLLFIARADAGEPRLKMQSVALAEMMNSVCKEFSANAEQKSIKIVKGRVDSKAVVRGDSGRLRQVFAILMDNALRYSNPGGRVEVRVIQKHDAVEISFQDEGIGLTEEETELAFQRFYRGHKAEGHARGTGLGLPVAKAIVEAHSGTISLSGKPGAGATATVIIPVGSQLRIVA